jgi:transitional endoplasmic reticulum ATPase
MRRDPDAVAYRRGAARLTSIAVLHPAEKAAAVAAGGRFHQRQARSELEAGWAADERVALAEAQRVLSAVEESAAQLERGLAALVAVKVPDLLGEAENEHHHVAAALDHVAAAAQALAALDFGRAGAEVETAERELTVTGRGFVVALNRALAAAAIGKEAKTRLEDNLAERRQAKIRLDHVKATVKNPAEVAEATGALRRAQALGYTLAAEVLGAQTRAPRAAAGERAGVGRGNEMRVVPASACETFADIGGLEQVKQQLRETVGAILERPDEAARYQVVHNGVLFYGPPGTGKNLLSRALAGEYGLRYLRFSPAAIASAYLHEAAANLRQVFELAARSSPCVLYLDEIDTIASDRGDQPSADHREVVTQLMICLEEYRAAPGLVICAATNDLDRLDPALREGRFDAKVQVPLPGADDRARVIDVHLQRRLAAVDAESLDLAALAQLTHGYSAAALETVVSLAAQAALRDGTPITQDLLAKTIRDRGGQHRISIEEHVTWDDVVLAPQTRERVHEVVTVFTQPDLARTLGVAPPLGILLYGPPGTGKTTIAKAMASQIAGSFYELSAAELLSKWAGESEQRVAKLFAKARANRPSIVFIDEIDALLRRRTADANNKWEERVLSQFLRELDGLTGDAGVLLVGATNRIDTIDEAIVGRRLEPIEVGLPDALGRHKLLQVLCRDVRLAKTVNLRTLTQATEGMSGADLKGLRDAAGRKALARATKSGKTGEAASVTMADFTAALDARRDKTSLVRV